jgi:uncharacterized OsmC-like protein
MSETTRYAPIVVTHEGGLRFAAQIRSHRVIVDQPTPKGGDSGPMPIEMLGVSLGTCVAHYVRHFLEVRELPSEGLRVEVEQVAERNPNRIGEFAVRVVLPSGVPAAYSEMLQRVARSCPAHNTLTQGARVAVQIDAGVPPESYARSDRSAA